jgi:DNA-binding transcriptional regulator YhcF (GntR family)
MPSAGWIKLYVQTLDNPIWQRDRTAWQIFEYLMLRAYTSNPQNRVVTSRQQIAEACDSNNNTVYKALIRLRNAKMVTTTATSKYTTICICNWHIYQSNGNSSSNNKVTTKQQQSNTLKKSKDIRVKNNKETIIYSDVTVATNNLTNEVINLFQGVNPHYARLFANKSQRAAVDRMLKLHGRDKLSNAIEAAKRVLGKEFYPQITTPLQLEEKWGRLVASIVSKKPKFESLKKEKI